MRLPCNLPLTHGIDAGDVIDAFNAVLIALMNRINVRKARPHLCAGGFVNPNRITDRPGLNKAHTLGLIAITLAQSVQMRDRQPGQPLSYLIGQGL